MSPHVPPARRVRRLTAGASLVLFPALLVPQAIIDPAAGGTGEVMFRAATEDRGALTLSAVLLMASALFMAPAAAAVLHLARDRGAALADVGAVLAVLGAFGHVGIAMFYLVALPLAGGDETQMVAYVDRLNETAAVGAVAFPLILCFGLALLVLPWAVWRAGAVHWWVPAVTTVAFLAEMGLPATTAAADVVVLGVVTVAYTALAVRVLRMTDAEWDGVRPAVRSEVMLPA